MIEELLQRYLGEIVMGAVVALAILSVSVGGLVAFLRRRSKLEAWESFAHRMGLRLEPGGLIKATQVVGEIKGRAFGMIEISGDDDSPKRTRVELTVANPHFAKLTLEREGKLFKLIDRAVMGESIQTGDAAFDQKFTAHGDPPELLRSALADPLVRDRLGRLKGGARIKLIDTTLSLWLWGVEKDASYLAGAAEALSDLADRIDGWQPPPGWGVERIDARGAP